MLHMTLYHNGPLAHGYFHQVELARTPQTIVALFLQI
uniref:Uncharacterized protein n=1 Tax=Anguilla anguilla TaxID=7936 RepID=A0A0E9QIY7_ANGAN